MVGQDVRELEFEDIGLVVLDEIRKPLKDLELEVIVLSLFYLPLFVCFAVKLQGELVACPELIDVVKQNDNNLVPAFVFKELMLHLVSHRFQGVD